MAMTSGHHVNVDALRERMEELGLTHRDVAKAMGVTRPAVTNILSGRQRLSPARAKRLARALNLRRWQDLIIRTPKGGGHG